MSNLTEEQIGDNFSEESEKPDVISFYASRLDEDMSFGFTGLSSLEELKNDLSGSGEEIVSFFQIPYTPSKGMTDIHPDEFENSMNILRGLLCTEGIQLVFEYLLERVFLEGRRSVLKEENREEMERI